MSHVDIAADPALERRRFLGFGFNMLQFEEVVRLLEASDPAHRFRYVVTPNVDHVVRLSDRPELVRAYEGAWLTLCDSRPLRALSWFVAAPLPLVTGSDLTVVLFHRVMPAGARLAVVAPGQDVLDALQARFPQFEIVGYVPPHGLDARPEELARCARFVSEAKASYIFLAVGAPQSERIAHLIAADPAARGTGFCVGAALEFITDRKRRAPRWMRRIGLEWLHRLAGDPRRLWKRYVFAVPRLSALFAAEALRRRSSPNG